MGINSTANWIDSFFRGERIEIEEEYTHLSVKLSGFIEKDESAAFQTNTKLRFVLPHLKNRVFLLASGILEEDDARSKLFDASGEKEDSEESFNLSLRYFLKPEKGRNISLRAGLRFHGWPLTIFIGPRLRFSETLSTWNLRCIEDAAYFSDSGWESETTIDLEKTLADTFFFRMNLSTQWYESEPGFFYSFNNDLYHTLNDHQMFNYRLSIMFETSPGNRMSEVLTRIRYRQRFCRDWLFFEISPQIAFRREDNYHPTPGITLSIEGLFGKKFIHHARTEETAKGNRPPP
jgi:hypothetical protein